ncbi:hypothetical protein [Undibacterium sp. TC9W]|uniref:hypothetical protein n=1 Tax=Undibacterium sp. TC9W TaxID=3413053 RepID=UPI003BF12C9F
MTLPPPTQDELRMVHTALHLEVPFDQASPLILATLTTIAHCWRGRIPAHLWGRSDSPASARKQPQGRFAGFGGPPDDKQAATTDFKRRASGDFD